MCRAKEKCFLKLQEIINHRNVHFNIFLITIDSMATKGSQEKYTAMIQMSLIELCSQFFAGFSHLSKWTLFVKLDIHTSVTSPLIRHDGTIMDRDASLYDISIRKDSLNTYFLWHVHERIRNVNSLWLLDPFMMSYILRGLVSTTGDL